jgi:hypothetical protein
MKKVSFFKKLQLLRTFNKAIKENKVELQNKFNIRIDRAKRLYTVLNIPEELIGEAYSLKKSDIDRISETYIKSYGEELATFLNSKGLSELYQYYQIEKVDKYAYLLVFGFRLIKSDKFYKNVYYIILPASVIVSLSLLFIFL